MTIRFQCTAGHPLSAPESRSGQEVHCPVCKETVQVPKPSRGKASHEVKLPPVRSGRKRREAAWSGTEQLQGGPNDQSERAAASPQPRRRLRDRFRRPPKLVPPDAYRADKGHLESVRWLGVIVSIAVVFSMLPALGYLDLRTAPGWARAVLLLGALQLFFIVWVINQPDWASVWVLMLVFAGMSTLYGMATAMAIATPLDQPMLLGMGAVRDSSGRWCGSVLLVMSLCTYLCGRVSTRWHRSFKLGTAGRKVVKRRK
jgi:hypothetical protein